MIPENTHTIPQWLLRIPEAREGSWPKNQKAWGTLTCSIGIPKEQGGLHLEFPQGTDKHAHLENTYFRDLISSQIKHKQTALLTTAEAQYVSIIPLQKKTNKMCVYIKLQNIHSLTSIQSKHGLLTEDAIFEASSIGSDCWLLRLKFKMVEIKIHSMTMSSECTHVYQKIFWSQCSVLLWGNIKLISRFHLLNSIKKKTSFSIRPEFLET